jgi:hypothetical protein
MDREADGFGDELAPDEVDAERVGGKVALRAVFD